MEKEKKKTNSKKVKNDKLIEINPEIESDIQLNIEEKELEEKAVLDISQRRKRAMAMRRNRARLKMGRKKAKKKRASNEKLRSRARKKALGVLRDRLVKSKSYGDMSNAEKVAVDKRLSKIPDSRINSVARKLLPAIRKKEMEKFSGKTESLDSLFEMRFGYRQEISNLIENVEKVVLESNANEKMLEKALNYLKTYVEKDPKHYHSLESHAFEILRMFSLNGINARTLANLYRNKFGMEEDYNTCDIITYGQMKQFEILVDSLFEKYGIDFEFTKHFRERMSDKRNEPCITLKELAVMLKKLYMKQKTSNFSLSKFKDTEAVLKDMQSLLNMPVVLEYDRNKDELVVIAKTIMRKKNFKSSSKQINI